jgi:FkbM family methyltransferase
VSARTAESWVRQRQFLFEELAASVAEFVPARGTIVDVGANVGAFTKTLIERHGFEGEAHLFEPVGNLAALCKAALAPFGTRINVYSMALGDREGVATMRTSTNGNLGWNTLVAEAATADMGTTEVPMRVYDSLGLPDPDFVKIDVEGSEYLVLAGMMETIVRARPVIACEIGWGEKHPHWNEELAVFEKLAALGYRTVDMHRRPVNVRALRATADVLFVPPDELRPAR